jgi:hypothetical protein
MTQNQLDDPKCSSYKLEYFDTENLKTIVTFNDTAYLSSCVIAPDLNVYFSTFNTTNGHSAFYNFSRNISHKISTQMEKLVLDNHNHVYGYDVIPSHYILKQYVNKSIITKFIFDKYFRVFSLFYVKELSIFVINISSGFITMANWKILQIYKFNYFIYFVCYHDGLLYMIIEDSKLISFDLQSGLSKVLLTYEEFLYYHSASIVIHNTLYSIYRERDNNGISYLVRTNLTSLDYNITKLSFPDTIVCIISN